MNTDHLKVDKDLFKKKNIGWQRVVARYSIFSIHFMYEGPKHWVSKYSHSPKEQQTR